MYLLLDHTMRDRHVLWGGFGNVWGAAMLPYTAHDLGKWPISAADMADSYRNVSRFVPMGAERDQLQGPFPLYHDKVTTLIESEQTQNLLKFLTRRDPQLRCQGVTFGRARVAVDSSGGPSTCRYCGHCLDGCPYGSIFNPRLLWGKFEQNGIKIHKGWYAIEFKEEADSVVLSAVNIKDGSLRRLQARRLFVGMGAISTARLIARSLKIINKPIRLLDSQYFFFLSCLIVAPKIWRPALPWPKCSLRFLVRKSATTTFTFKSMG